MKIDFELIYNLFLQFITFFAIFNDRKIGLKEEFFRWDCADFWIMSNHDASIFSKNFAIVIHRNLFKDLSQYRRFYKSLI